MPRAGRWFRFSPRRFFSPPRRPPLPPRDRRGDRTPRNNIFLVQLLLGNQIRQCPRRRHLHLLVDVARAHVKRAAEHAGERQHVVDLVGIVAATGGHHPRAARLGVVGEDFRRGVRAGEHDRVLVHRPHHVCRQRAGGGDADEHVRAADHVGKRTLFHAAVGDPGHLLLDPVEPLAPLVDRALAVSHHNVGEARGEQQLRDRDRRRARAGGHHLDVLFFLAYDLERVGKPRQRDDGGAVLVVVEDGDVALFLELAFDLKAAGGGNVLQIDAAERPGDVVHRLHKLVHVLRLDAEGEGVHAAEVLEQDALALHDRHAGFGTDIAEPQHRRPVGDDGAEVVAARQLIALVDVLLNFQARLRHAGGVRQR